MPHTLNTTDFNNFSSSQIAKQKSAYIVKTARSVTVTNILAPLFALLLFYDDADPLKLTIWLAYMAVATFIRTWFTAKLEYQEEKIDNPNKDLAVVTFGVALIGFGWGLGWILLVPDLDTMNRMIYLYVTAGGMFNAMFGYCVHWPTFYSFIIPTMVPAISTVLWNRDIFPWPFAIGISILFICVIKIAKNFSKTFEESVRLRLRNEKLYQELSVERDQSIAANVAKSNFVASASHDLRQPMYAVNMYLDSLNTDAMPPTEKATISKIKNSVVTLNEMFEALLNISKLDSMSFRSTNQPFEIERLVESLKAVVKPHALHKQLKIQFNIGPKYAVGDEALLSQMLLNLINNAIHYTDQGEVVVNFFSYANCLHISVTDTGCGISLDDQSRIFQEFFRVDKTRDHHDGLGLGLSIVSRLCKLIGAEISIDSKIDHGTVFTVSTKFPVSEQIDVLDEHPYRTQRKKISSASILGKTIAVIEDDPVVLEAYAQALTTRGAIVIKVALERDAFANQMALLDASTIDFIISDYRLKTSSGAEMISKLRELYNEEIPAMIVTADTSPSHIQYFSELNIPVLHKPVSFQQVIAVVESKFSEISQ
ncbi:hybrid sensor histidine kinase/response regulator [Limnohabitans sp. MORI2]|uniref:ATP-binding response regulator n=1 Tax=Limnohabitans sp. MORI2 TaxID=1751150 RepID=UPI002377CBC2|nr:ATP-binding protein [Limnohabitans sp. MORI2]BDU58992.1 hybrid sensor histidine kinase/response regulator [Limnohabitans sp. MORI2]